MADLVSYGNADRDIEQVILFSLLGQYVVVCFAVCSPLAVAVIMFARLVRVLVLSSLVGCK